MKLKSDRELDRWIAENVTNEPRRKVDMITDVDRWGKTIYMGFTLTHPNYTSDLNEAIKVFEWITYNYTVDEYAYNLSMGTYKEHKGRWFIVREDYTDGISLEEDFIQSQESPAMAICLAAYKLKTGKEWGCNAR